jgi:molybdopterin-guanine dinucleotide biosynthesis protein A
MNDELVGVVLAGGRSTRMGGGDKCLREIAGRPILAHIVERARGQVDALILNANGEAARFASFGLPVVADPVDGFAGPLAGVLAGLDWAAAHRPGAAWVASFACDAPFFPRDLVARLAAAVAGGKADMACAASGGRNHPVFGLWPVALRGALRDALVRERLFKVGAWIARYRLATVAYDAGAADPFFNLNEPEDLERARRLVGGVSG